MIAPRRSHFVAIVGGSGAGKGWLVDRLCGLLGDHACHLELDHFYRDRSHLPPALRAAVNFDEPRAIDWAGAERVLLDCRVGHPTRLPRYDFATHSRIANPDTWEPRPIVFVDGLWLLRRPGLRRRFDLSVFLNTPRDLRRRRRLARDVRERGGVAAEVARRFAREVTPLHQRFVEPQRRWADVVLDEPFVTSQLIALAARLWPLVENAAPVTRWTRDTFRAGFLSVLLTHESTH